MALEVVPLIAVTLFFVGSFTYAYATLQLEEIRANWEARRCDPLVMTMAQMVPTDPAVDKDAFATENFSFCIGRLVQASIGAAMAPMLATFGQTMNATEPINQAMNSLRGSAASLTDPIQSIFSKSWDKFRQIGWQIVRIFSKLTSAMHRIFGIAVSSVFAGIAVMKGIQNAVGFVIQVCIIILIILSILVIFAWFFMWPIIPIIIMCISVISSTVYAANVSGLSGSFCVAAGTEVACKDGWRPVETVLPGQELADGQKVEGILVMTAEGSSCVELEGVVLSDSHLVFWQGAWRSAGECSSVRVPVKERLFCLNTSGRTWVVRGGAGKGTQGQLLLRDWEELPDGCDEWWQELVSKLINHGLHVKAPAGAMGRGLFGRDTLVYEKQRGPINISAVHIGDVIKDKAGEREEDDTWTTVLGIVADISESTPVRGPNRSAWVKKGALWVRMGTRREAHEMVGYHLITSSGTFTADSYWVRDFTEVGAQNIAITYPYVLSVLDTRFSHPPS